MDTRFNFSAAFPISEFVLGPRWDALWQMKTAEFSVTGSTVSSTNLFKLCFTLFNVPKLARIAGRVAVASVSTK